MEITKHVHAIKIPFQVKTDERTLERFVYSYLIKGNEICLIDSGIASSKEIIFSYMDKIGLNHNDISLMILTHSHPDHIGSAKSIQKKSNCEIAAHQNEIHWIEDVELQANERPVPNFHSLVEGSVNVDIILTDGDLIDLGGNITLKVIHTPGHSKGSISLFIKEEGILFTGDAVPLKGDLPIYDDFTKSIRSIGKLMEIKEIKVLLASWDDPKEDIQAYNTLDKGLDYLKNINESVYKINSINSFLSEIEFCKKVLEDLELPSIAANPIVAKSIQANLNEMEK